MISLVAPGGLYAILVNMFEFISIVFLDSSAMKSLVLLPEYALVFFEFDVSYLYLFRLLRFVHGLDSLILNSFPRLYASFPRFRFTGFLLVYCRGQRNYVLFLLIWRDLKRCLSFGLVDRWSWLFYRSLSL